MAFQFRRLKRYDYASYLTYIAYSGCSVIVPIVLVELARELNFPLESGGKGAGGALQIGRSLPMVLAMIFCGFAAGRWGKRLTIGVSILLMGAGIGLASCAPGYGILFLLLAVAGLGEGVVEGLSTPVVQELHEDDEPGRYINFAHGFWSIGIVLMTLLAGWLLEWHVNWRTILAGVGIFSLFPALMFLLPDRRAAEQFKTQRLKFGTVWSQTKEIMKTGRFWLFFAMMFFAGGGEFGLTFWAAAYVRLVFGGTPMQGALATMIFSVGMIAGRLGSAVLIPQRKTFWLLLGAAGGGVLVGAVHPLCGNLYLSYAGFLLLGLASAPLWPSTQSYCVDRLPKLDSTVIYIVLSCAGVPGCGVLAYILGALGDKIDLRHSLLLVPLCYGVYVLLLAFERWHWPPESTQKRP